MSGGESRDDADVHNNLGLVLAKAGRTEEAAEQFRAALRADPGFAPAHLNLGTALASQGKRGPALAEFRRALELEPRNVKARRNIDIVGPS